MLSDCKGQQDLIVHFCHLHLMRQQHCSMLSTECMQWIITLVKSHHFSSKFAHQLNNKLSVIRNLVFFSAARFLWWFKSIIRIMHSWHSINCRYTTKKREDMMYDSSMLISVVVIWCIKCLLFLDKYLFFTIIAFQLRSVAVLVSWKYKPNVNQYIFYS